MPPPSLRTLALVCALGLAPALARAQGEARSYDLARGQVLDLLLLADQPANDSARDVYFRTAFPVAERHGFAFLPGFAVERPHLLGNRQPTAAVFGTWPSLAAREAALRALEAEVDRFHALRREIWSTFDVTYWELADDLAFVVPAGGYVTLTAYWSDDPAGLDALLARRRVAVAEAGGEAVAELRDGASPVGYRYAPDYLALTVWTDAAAYAAARAAAPAPDDGGVLTQVHELALR